MLFRYPDITIIVRPIGRGLFETRHAGRVLIAASAEPLLAAARALLGEGYRPGATLALKHQGAVDIALQGRIGALARITIKDNRHGTPRVRRWMPPPGVTQTPPMRFPRQELPDIRGAQFELPLAGGVS